MRIGELAVGDEHPVLDKTSGPGPSVFMSTGDSVVINNTQWIIHLKLT